MTPPSLSPVSALSLTLLCGALLGISECDPNIDTDEDGYTSDVDCDDQDPHVHPGALEACDGQDDDCDGVVDNGATGYSYTDQDGDGYGAGPALPCQVGEGFAASPHDCDDLKAAVYPTAPDFSGDGIDQSCDGRDGNAPSVGFNTSKLTTLQQALDAAQDGETVWVAPGLYQESWLDFQGKAVKLISILGELETTIDAEGKGPVFQFITMEQSETVLEGFTLRRGQAAGFTLSTNAEGFYGGGIFLQHASPTLSHLRLIDNRAGGSCYYTEPAPALFPCGDGGGIYMEYSNALLSDVLIEGNSANIAGGGIYANESNPLLTRVTVAGNRADGQELDTFGGGIYLLESSPILIDVLVEDNQTSYWGGGLYVRGGSPVLQDVQILGNRANGDIGSGGGLYLNSTTPSFLHVEIAHNEANNAGGGFSLSASTLKMTGVNIFGNRSNNIAGGVWSGDSSLTLNQGLVLNNQAAWGGGGLWLGYSTAYLQNSVVAYNFANSNGNLEGYCDHYGCSGKVKATYSNLYNPVGYSGNNITPTGTYTTVEPQFLAYRDSSTGASCVPAANKTCLPNALHLALTSPVINAGDPALLDIDGSGLDLGLYGGLEGGGWDRDQDGLPDYFWPGTWADVPEGTDASAYDADDTVPFGG